jgi:hypothetical protein
MKPITITACLLLVGPSLYAAEPQAQPKDDPTTQAAPRTETVFSTAQTGVTGDSPLVRAAKASRRPGKKSSTVVTNETLVRTGGHFTTTTLEAQKPLPLVPTGGRSMDQLAADARKKKADAEATATTARKLEEQKKTSAAQTQSREEGYTPEALYDEPPATENPLQPLKPATPSTAGQQPKPKPPV